MRDPIKAGLARIDLSEAKACKISYEELEKKPGKDHLDWTLLHYYEKTHLRFWVIRELYTFTPFFLLAIMSGNFLVTSKQPTMEQVIFFSFCLWGASGMAYRSAKVLRYMLSFDLPVEPFKDNDSSFDDDGEVYFADFSEEE